MVAQNSADFPTFRGQARQRGRGFGALAQTLGRTAIPLIKKYIVPAKRVGEDLIDIAAPEIGEVVSGRKKTENICKRLGTKTVRKQLGGGKKKSKRKTGRTRTISRKVDRKTVALAKTFLII